MLHPRNRKFPPTQLLSESHIPTTLRNGIAPKITNTTRHQGSPTKERQLSQASANSHLVSKPSTSEKNQKQGYVSGRAYHIELFVYFVTIMFVMLNYRRLESQDEMKPSFEEFAAYLKYLTEKKAVIKQKQSPIIYDSFLNV